MITILENLFVPCVDGSHWVCAGDNWGANDTYIKCNCPCHQPPTEEATDNLSHNQS